MNEHKRSAINPRAESLYHPSLHEAELLEKAAPDCPPEGSAVFRACAALLRDSARKAMESLGEEKFGLVDAILRKLSFKQWNPVGVAV
jgi:hypothetical protein